MQTVSDSAEASKQQASQREGIDLVAAYQTIIRVLAHLESEEYTSDRERQADVSQHDDLPDPTSDNRTRQG